MNEPERTLDAADDATLDLLVDGELTDEQTHWLLAALEEQPDGWRRCALAFVEAQSWNRDLGEIRHTSLAGVTDPVVQATYVQSIAPKRLLPLLLAMAASVLIALVSGIGIGQRWQDDAAPIVTPRKSTPPADQPSGESLLVETDHSGAAPRAADVAGEPFQVPVYLASQVSEDYWQNTPPPLSARLRRALARSGHEAELTRQWIPLQFEDGSQIVFPVDEVKLRYVGNPSYQ